MSEERILRGVITELANLPVSDGGFEERVVVRLAGGTWDLPVSYFTEAGFEELIIGESFRVTTPTPYGKVPRTLGMILPPVREES